MKATRYTASPYGVLPPDYPDLSEDGKRQARLNALHLQETPDDLVRAWNFFCDVYLARQPGDKTLPEGFFYKRRLPPPDFHSQMVWDAAYHPRTVYGAPRSSAKSTVLRSLSLLLLLTRPYMSILSILASDTQVKKWTDRLIYQVEHNPLIRKDFGDMKPKRGQTLWSRHNMTLTNQANLSGISMGGRMLGERPDMIILDDPEYDPDSPTKGLKDTDRLASEMERLLFNVIGPMLDEAVDGSAGTILFWIGTLLNRRSYIYHAVKTTTDEKFFGKEEGGRPFWNRVLLAAAKLESDEVVGPYLWPEKWPKKTMELYRVKYGEAFWRSSWLNDPGSDSELLFKMDPEYGWYWMDGQHPATTDKPLESRVLVRWKEVTRTEQAREVVIDREEPAGELFGRMWRLLTLDYGRELHDRADSSCILVQGFDSDNRLWLLDLWLGKVSSDVLLRKMWDFGIRWQVSACGIEAVGIQKQLVERAMSDMREDMGWKPRPVPILYPSGLTKGDRIAGLEWRFRERGWLRFPWDLRKVSQWREMHRQVMNFTPDLALLDHDDAVDTLAMHQFLQGRARGLKPTQPKRKLSPLEHLERGEVLDPATGNSYFDGLNACELTPKAMAALEGASDDEGDKRQWMTKG